MVWASEQFLVSLPLNQLCTPVGTDVVKSSYDTVVSPDYDNRPISYLRRKIIADVLYLTCMPYVLPCFSKYFSLLNLEYVWIRIKPCRESISLT
jgi:hypothetical protein